MSRSDEWKYKVKAEIMMTGNGDVKVEDVFYECDRARCNHCNDYCHLTTDFRHARRYRLFDQIGGNDADINNEM